MLNRRRPRTPWRRRRSPTRRRTLPTRRLFLLPAPSAADAVAATLNPDAHVDALGRTIGQAGWTVASAAAGFAGRAAVEYMKQPRKPKADTGW